MANKLPKQLLLVVAGLVLAALFAEIGMRIYHDVDYLRPGQRLARDADSWGESVHQRSRVPGLSYELKPGVERETRGMLIRTNSLGLRGPEPLPRETPGLVRIAVLGDSIAFGYGVQEEETWPAQLRAALKESPPCPGRTFDVLNFGVAGYSTRDEALVFRHKAVPLAPDLVIVGYFFNDPDIDPTQPLELHFMQPKWWHYSAFLRWCALVRANSERKRIAGNDYWRWLHHPETRMWQSVTRGFADIAEQARAVPVIVVIFPLIAPTRPWAEYRYHDLHAQVRAEAERHGFHVLDLLETYSRHEPKELMLAPNDFHPTPLAHGLVRDLVKDFLAAHPELVCGGG